MSASLRIFRAYSRHAPQNVKPLFTEDAELIRKAKTMLKHDHSDASKMWKRLSLFVALPMIALSCVNSYLRKQEGHGTRPEYREYEHLRIRSKRFPWGDGNHSFFHNPHNNPIPSVGYEE